MAKSQYIDEELLKAIGNRIRELREKMKWTQEYFAEKCEIDTRQLGRIERAESNSTISTLNKIANGFGITLSKLLEDLP